MVYGCTHMTTVSGYQRVKIQLFRCPFQTSLMLWRRILPYPHPPLLGFSISCYFLTTELHSDITYLSTLCSEKNTHSHFLLYLRELFVDLNKNCTEYTQGLIDSENAKIRYSLRSMTYFMTSHLSG